MSGHQMTTEGYQAEIREAADGMCGKLTIYGEKCRLVVGASETVGPCIGVYKGDLGVLVATVPLGPAVLRALTDFMLCVSGRVDDA